MKTEIFARPQNDLETQSEDCLRTHSHLGSLQLLVFWEEALVDESPQVQ